MLYGGALPVERVVMWGRSLWTTRVNVPLYSSVCDGPCTTRIGLGAHWLALAKPGQPAIAASEPVVLEGPAALRGTYTDRSGLRAAGWALFLGGTLAGAAMLVASAHPDCNPGGCLDDGWLFGGIGTIAASTAVGLVLAMQRDQVHFSIEPLRLAPTGAMRERPLTSLAVAPQGAALTVGF